MVQLPPNPYRSGVDFQNVNIHSLTSKNEAKLETVVLNIFEMLFALVVIVFGFLLITYLP
eukprot:Pgem_evm1s6131